MKTKKRMHRLGSGVLGMTKIGMVSGVGLSGLSAMGAPAGFGAGITQVGTFMPTIGTMMGAREVMGMTADLNKLNKKRKRK